MPERAWIINMYENFTEIIMALKNYIGSGYIFYLYLIAAVYLIFAEKEKRLRVLLIYAPLTILAAFLLPVTRHFYGAIGLDQETYYRILWLVPMGLTIAYSGCKLFAAHRRVGLLISITLVILAGTYVYNNPHISKAENLYNIPGATIHVCDYILADAEFDYIHAVFPKEHVQYVRQYSSHIKLAYGREMLVERWGFDNAIYDLTENQDIIDIVALLEVTRPLLINYIVIHWTRAISDNPENYGLLLLDQVDGLLIYRDEEVAQYARDVFGPAYPKRW